MDFVWECHPEAEKLIENLLEGCCAQNSSLFRLKQELELETSTRLFDWIDYLAAMMTPELRDRLIRCGFEQQLVTDHYRIYTHPGAQLPRVVAYEKEMRFRAGAAVTVDSISDFLCVRGILRDIEGAFFTSFRRCTISLENDVAFWIIERRGTLSIEPSYSPVESLSSYFRAVESWEIRPRRLEDEDLCMNITIQLAQKLVSLVGQDLAASIVLQGERKYWQARNTSGQLQKNRQDRLGMGWANHDHHTFRSSRRHFKSLVQLFEILGFHCRERFYAGEEAGWGAQVMENPRGKFVLFLDVDLDTSEVSGDFAHEDLPELKRVGTIGLWCGLHGDSILQGGMHHLEAQFLFEELKADLSQRGIEMMEPFSFFPFLKQAFTKGETWKVSPERIQKLVEKGLITKEQADHFLSHGAIGSHLENLQRREGYKGFNQKNVSKIIKSTDPRTPTIELKGA